MTKLLSITINDLRVTFAEKGIWINLVVIPVLLILILGVVQGGFETTGGVGQRVDIIDFDESELSAQMLDQLRAVNPNLVLCPMDNDEDDRCRLGDDATMSPERSDERLLAGATRAILEIPAGFSAHVLSGEPVTVVYRSDEDPTQPSAILQAVQAVTQRIGAASVASQVGLYVYEDLDFTFSNDGERGAFRQAVYDRASALWSELPEVVAFQEVITRDEEGFTSTGGGFRQAVPGMGSMYVMFTVLGGMVILLQERRHGTLQRLVTMPVRRAQLLGGKVLARFIMGMIQFGVAFGVGALLGVSFSSIPALLLLMISFTLCITGLSILLATMVTREEQAGVLITFIALTLAPLGGAWWPLEIVPDFMRTIGHISPVAWVMNGFGELIYYGGGLADVWLSIAVLLAMAAALFSLAVLRFRIE
jgi:ABC-2 type transport system permease protein